MTRWTVADALRYDQLSDDLRQFVERRVAQQVDAAVDAQTRFLRSHVKRMERQQAALREENDRLHKVLLRTMMNFAARQEEVMRELTHHRVRAVAPYVDDAVTAVQESIPDDRAARILEEHQSPMGRVA